MNINFFTSSDQDIAIAAKNTGPSTMTVTLETITPELAQQILDGNTDNRPLKKRHVTFLSEQMRLGAWQVTGDPIKISASGRLLDGQHRLMAIVNSQTTQQIYVARDCQEEIFSVLDTGAVRSAGDVLATAGRKNHVVLAASAKLLIMHERGRLAQTNSNVRQLTHALILDWATRHDLDESTTRAHAWTKRCKLLNTAEWSALNYLFSQASTNQQAYDFLQQISTGLNLTEGHPVLILRIKLQQARDGRFNFSPAERMALTVKAWNALRERKKVTQLQWRSSEEFPEII